VGATIGTRSIASRGRRESSRAAWEVFFGFPTGVPDKIRHTIRKPREDWWVTPTVEGGWFPEAFLPPMASLMEFLETGKPPVTSGGDNLRPLQLVFAAYKSMEEKRAVSPGEIL
jgi:predicted dehydrogenase